MTDQSTPETPWPPARRGWWLVALLALASVVSQFDRTVINLMVGPIKAEFGLSDTAFGSLQSVAFGIFYVIACIPLGRMADNGNRKWLLAVCLGLWSLFAMASGLARTYWTLFATRIGVAVGEASLTPAALSMLADHFPAPRLGRPVAGFLMSAPLGQGLAFIGGGSLLAGLTGSSLLAPGGLLAGLAPWQAAFIIIGAPGLLLVPAFLLVREPVRRGARVEGISAGETARLIGGMWRALVPMFLGFAMMLLFTYSIAIWTPALLERVHGWTPERIGWGFGLLLIAFGMTGVITGGWLNDWVAAKGYADAPLRVAGTTFAIGGVGGVAAPLMPSGELTLAALGVALFFGQMSFPCAATSLQQIVPNRARAQISAVYVTFTTLVGLGVGPTVIGLMNDKVFGPEHIDKSMALVIGVAAPIMVVMMLLALKPYRGFREAAGV